MSDKYLDELKAIHEILEYREKVIRRLMNERAESDRKIRMLTGIVDWAVASVGEPFASKIKNELSMVNRDPFAEDHHMKPPFTVTINPGDIIEETPSGWLLIKADKAPPLIQVLHANGDRIAMEATIAQQAQRIADLEADKVRGEPVAWRITTPSGVVYSTKYPAWSVFEGATIEPLYAEQPAPVAAVMPERIKHRAENPAGRISYIKGWNACLDEFARLNSEPKP